MKQVYLIAPRTVDPIWPAKRDVVRRVSAELNWQAIIPTYDTNSVHVTSKLFDDLKKAQLVLADLSCERPSCYYELGAAEVLGIPVRLIAKVQTPVHQTASRSAVVEYESLEDYEVAVRAALTG